MTTSVALDELTAAGVHVVTDPDTIAAYSRDQSVLQPEGGAIGVAFPDNTAQVQAVMRWATAHLVPVVVRGAGTGVAGASVPRAGELVVSMSRMKAVLDIDRQNMIATVQPGAITADVDRAAARVGLLYPPDPGSIESCSIGGNIATNAGGLRCVKYGVTRDSVAGLQVVLADGRLIHTGRRTVKNVSGYDLTGLIVGSEGTLGIVTEIDLRLRPRPKGPLTTIVSSFTSLAAAGEAVERIMADDLDPTLMELMDHATVASINEWKHAGFADDVAAVLVGQAVGPDSPERAEQIAAHMREVGGTDVLVSENEAEGEQLIGLRRLAYPAMERLGSTMPEDVAVPRSRLAEMLAAIDRIADQYGVRIATVAHAGDGNVHPTFIWDHGIPEPPQVVWDAADAIFRTAIDLGGTITGEHGIGVLKRAWLGADIGETELAVNEAIKAALDPHSLFAPGRAV